MTTAASLTWRATGRPGAMFVAAASGADRVFVVAAAAGVAGSGAIAIAAVFIPGTIVARIVVIPDEARAS